MIGVILYVVATLWLCYNAWAIKKSDKKMQPVTALYLFVFFLMGEQALFAILFHLVHLPIDVISIAITNALLGVGLFFAAKKLGKQTYDLPQLVDLIAVIVVTLMVGIIAVKTWDSHLYMAFISSDGEKVHFMLAEKLLHDKALYHNNIQVFEALNGMIWMRITSLFATGKYALELGHMISQVINMWLSAFGFYLLLRTYSENKKDAITAMVLVVFYFLGYPLYATYYGFAYFVQIVNIIVAILLCYQLWRTEALSRGCGFVLLNLYLFSMFNCYSFFIPFVFPALFVALWIDESKKKSVWFSLKHIRGEFQLFLIPCVLGVMTAFSNVKQLGDGGGITNEGGCYMDLYSNFLRILPFVLIGVILLLKKKENDVSLLLLAWSFVVFVALIYLNHIDKISLYYVSKVYSIFWLCSFVLIFVAAVEIREKIPAVLLAFCLFFVACFGIAHSSVPQKINQENPAYAIMHADYHALFPDIYWFNQTMYYELHSYAEGVRRDYQAESNNR